jgi:Putative MetA-pathway of phenol degradation
MNSAICRLAAVLLLVMPGLAQQRPLLTEDPRIIPDGSLTTEVGMTYFSRARFPLSGLGGNELQFPVSGLHFSLGERAEFQLTGSLHNFLWIHENGSGTRNDFGDIEVSTKIRILDEKRRRPIIGFRPSVVLPNSDDQKGIGTNTTQFYASVLSGKHFGKIFVFGNAGLGILDDTLHARAQQDVINYGLAADAEIRPRVDVVGEIKGIHNPRKNPTPGAENRSEIRLGVTIGAFGGRWDFAGVAGLTRWDPRIGVVMGVSRAFRLWK